MCCQPGLKSERVHVPDLQNLVRLQACSAYPRDEVRQPLGPKKQQHIRCKHTVPSGHGVNDQHCLATGMHMLKCPKGGVGRFGRKSDLPQAATSLGVAAPSALPADLLTM